MIALVPLHAQKLGYALSGGGARGFAHIGVLKVLEEEGIKPNYIAGSSIGAIIGAQYAIGYNAAEIESLCLNIDWDGMTRDVHKRPELYIGQKRWTPYGNATFELNEAWIPQLPSSVFVGNNINLELFKLVAPASQVKDFDMFPIPFACNATNLVTGKPKTFVSGSLMQALRASMSIPSLVKPFEIDGQIYIDGGVSQNMPINLLHEMGSDKVIGIKVNSTLRNTGQLNNLVEILDQTINIGITRNLSESINGCDLVIEPDLSRFSSTDYAFIPDIIAVGEKSAREQLSAIRAFKACLTDISYSNKSYFDKNLDSFFVTDISIHGNVHISPVKVMEYLGLEKNKAYSANQISEACRFAWNSQVFSSIYPVLDRLDNGLYTLHIHIKERDRKEIALNLSYNSDDKLNAGIVLSLNNYVLKNSRLLSELKLGGKNELNVDYVKNFGEQWGAYYRIFGYLNEKTIYNYEDHHKVNSFSSIDIGFTSGLGLFAKDIAIGEFFVFSNRIRLYSDISQVPELPRQTVTSGFGIKQYHESLDDFVFPSKGLRIINRFGFARNVELSDYIYSSYHGKAEAYLPLFKTLSADVMINYGSYFNSDVHDKLDPYIFGGSDGFLGYSRYEVSAPHYQIVGGGFSSLLAKRLWLSLGSQALRYGDSDVWGEQKDWELCIYAGIGFQNKMLPAKLYLAINEAGRFNSQLSVGYDFDIFQFSRK